MVQKPAAMDWPARMPLTLPLNLCITLALLYSPQHLPAPRPVVCSPPSNQPKRMNGDNYQLVRFRWNICASQRGEMGLSTHFFTLNSLQFWNWKLLFFARTTTPPSWFFELRCFLWLAQIQCWWHALSCASTFRYNSYSTVQTARGWTFIYQKFNWGCMVSFKELCFLRWLAITHCQVCNSTRADRFGAIPTVR
jgi:hypothetical protein